MTVRQLAQASGVAHTRIVEYEQGTHQPTFERVERLLASAGFRLIPIPTRPARPTAAEIADEIATVLAGDGARPEHRAFRLALALHDHLRAPPSTRSARS